MRGSIAFVWLGAAGSASCREHNSFRRLEMPLFVLRKHFVLTSGREEPALWHAASACQLSPRMGREKEGRDGNYSPQNSPAVGGVSRSLHPSPSVLPLPPAESFHYLPGEEIRPGIPGQEISVSFLAITFLFLLSSGPKSLSLSHKSN